MNSLGNLPDEILAQILDTGTASDRAIQLWLCGDSRLTTRLARAGCRSFRTQPGLQGVRWPSVLSKLKGLIVLDFQAYCIQNKDSSTLLDEIMKLPPTLEELTLHVGGAPAILLHAAKFRSLSGANFAACLPNLRLLSLGALPGMEQPFFGSFDFSVLPRSLVSLKWDASLHYRVESPSFESLPRGLRSLELRSQANLWPPQLISTLPSELTSLDGVSGMSLECIAQLPKTLQHGDYAGFTCPWTSDLASSVPPLTRSLFLGFQPYIDFNSCDFPRSITELAIIHKFSVAELSLLPRTLLILRDVDLVEDTITEHVGMCTTNGTDCSAFWPPQLATLHFKGITCSLSTASDLTALPRSLRTLENLRVVYGNESSDKLENTLALLPPNLTILAIAEPDAVDFPVHALCFLPPGLLEFTFTTALAHSDLQQSITAIPRLKHLFLGCLHVKYFSILPKSLISLRIGSVYGNIADNVLGELPSSLESLTLETLVSPFRLEFAAFTCLPASVSSVDLGSSLRDVGILVFMPTTVRRFTRLHQHASTETLAKLSPYWVVWLDRHTRIGHGGRLKKLLSEKVPRP